MADKLFKNDINRKQICFLLIMVCTFFFCSFGFGQNQSAELDQFFATINANGDLNGSVLVMENGNVLYQKSFGFADKQNKIQNTENTLFQIASVSKIFTAVAVLKLEEQKKLNIQDKIVSYFPDFPYSDVTIYNLLSNTSGVPDIGELLVPFWRLNRDTVFTLNDLIPALNASKMPQNFEAGMAWEYSNTNFSLLALLIEKTSGQKFADYMNKNIFKPAGMHNTFVKSSGENAYVHNNVAYNYGLPYIFSITPVRVDSFAINDFKVHYKTFPSEGDANIYTSVIDLAAFDKALYGGLLLKEKNLNLLTSPSRKTNGKKIVLHGLGSEIGVIGDFYWGLGNRIDLDSSMGKIVWCSGGMPGCSANMLTNSTKNQLIIWLNNEQSSSAMDNMFGALNIINNKPASAKKAKGNGAIIYAQLLQKNDKEHAFAKLIEMADDTTNFIVDENTLNDLAYEFYEFVNENLAFETLRSAIFLFPNNDNLYNSYGELLAKSGKKEEAIIMYKKSLILNPENEDSINSLNKLQME
ncbi:MAG: class A beta-lactamase-related serine hydrolase [Bacteroidetes bacterium]|nr:class A beta-lactamase-related serine hydrolase [Bacteroidota bacterium]